MQNPEQNKPTTSTQAEKTHDLALPPAQALRQSPSFGGPGMSNHSPGFPNTPNIPGLFFPGNPSTGGPGMGNPGSPSGTVMGPDLFDSGLPGNPSTGGPGMGNPGFPVNPGAIVNLGSAVQNKQEHSTDINSQNNPYFGLPPVGTTWITKSSLRARIEGYGTMVIDGKEKQVIISSSREYGSFCISPSYIVTTLEQWQEAAGIVYSVSLINQSK